MPNLHFCANCFLVSRPLPPLRRITNAAPVTSVAIHYHFCTARQVRPAVSACHRLSELYPHYHNHITDVS
jgi:hypothetical protein